MRFFIFLLMMLSTAVYGHSQKEHTLVSDDGYVWFHQDYDYKTNTATITNDRYDTRVANIPKVLRAVISTKRLEGQSIAITWSKEKLQNYLALSLKRTDIARALATLEAKDKYDIIFSDLYIESLDSKYLCEECTASLRLAKPDDDKLSLVDIPKHYFINNQVFLIHSNIYPGVVEINGNIKFGTILNVAGNDTDKKIKIYPASLKSQPIFLASRPPKQSGGGTGGGSSPIRVRKAPSHPDRQGP